MNIRGTQNVGLRVEGNELEVRKVLIELFNRKYSSYALPDAIYTVLNNTKAQYNLDNATFNRLITATKVVLSRIKMVMKYNKEYKSMKAYLSLKIL